MPHRTITRRAFGAYDPDVWIIQTYLSELGFDPGTIDGLWGGKTLDAALDFRSWAGMAPASDLTKSAVIDEAFWTQIDRATASAGFEINIAAPASRPGGAGVSPSVSQDTGPSSHQETPGPAPVIAGGSSMLLPLALLGVGAFIAFGGKKRR